MKTNTTHFGRNLFIGYLLFCVVAWFANEYFGEIYIETISRDFNNNKTLLCDGNKVNNQTYLVNIENGWSIYNNEYFKKDDLVIEIKQCEEQ
jgi:hypothetical protein